MEENMSEESFLLVSLKEKKAKKLAQVLSNDTSRKILDYLSKKNTGTETEIAKELDIPLSTVHYNLTHLVDAKLVKDDEFTYSEKGKEITHYSISNKYVIIAPKSTQGLKEKLKRILPVFLIISAVSFGINYVVNNLDKQMPKVGAGELIQATRDTFVEEAPKIAEEGIKEVVSKPLLFDNIALWFFVGAIFSLIVYGIVYYLYNRKK
jgi:DNA-binding transcriptional ArsR family regulator